MPDMSVLGTVPVAAWCPSLDTAGNGTQTLTDLSGNGNNGTLTLMDAATDWVADTGAGGVRALTFDGVNDEVQLASPITFTNDGTVAFWFRRGSGSNQALGAGGSYGEGYWFNISGNDVVQNWGNQYVTFSGEGANYAVGSWNHVTLVRSGSNYLIYRNGSLADTVVGAANPGTLRGFGRLYYGAGTFANLNGQLDDIRIFNTALTTEGIAYLYNSGNGRGVQPAVVSAHPFHPLQRGSTHPLRYT